MGNACCVAPPRRDKVVVPPKTSPPVGNLQRNNVRYSPNWSFRWDNSNRGRRVAGEDASLTWLSDGISRHDGSDLKSEYAFVSSQGSPLDNFQMQSWHKSPASDQSFSRVASIDTISEQVKKACFTYSLCTSITQNSAVPYRSPSTKRRSSATEVERFGNESHSDGWDMQAFSEMMAYSCRESCSYDHGKTKSNSDERNCGACLRSLSQRSLLSSEKITYAL
ncbi:unnamed protein product [Cochlearia groenlandica]